MSYASNCLFKVVSITVDEVSEYRVDQAAIGSIRELCPARIREIIRPMLSNMCWSDKAAGRLTFVCH